MTPHAIAGWAALAIVVAVTSTVAAGAAGLALRVRRTRTRQAHPLVGRALATARDLKRLQETRAALDALLVRFAHAFDEIRAVRAQRQGLRREVAEACGTILGNLRSIRDLLR